MSYSHLRPLLRLAFQLQADASVVEQRLIHERPKEERDFLEYLASQGDLAGAARMSARILKRATAKDLPVLLYAVDKQLEAGAADAALGVWESLRRSGLSELDGARGRGFHWRSNAAAGLELSQSGRAMRLRLSGRQAASAVAAERFIVLKPKQDCRLRWKADWLESPAGGEVRWRIGGGTAVIGTAPEAAWDLGPLTRSNGKENRLFLLQLIAERKPGQTRTEGLLEILQLTLLCAGENPRSLLEP